MIITCALSPSTSLTPSSVASPGGSALPAKPAEPIKFKLSDVKTEIDRVTDLKTSLENRINGQNNPLTEEENKRLNDCQSKLSALQTVQKLAEFADTLDTNNNASNNILNNLCSGLETFLGFNSNSKGYTGDGIVYSDLDRLCDGVMAFLSGVLEAVKDENEVTTYDNYISGMKLETVLSTLTTNIGKGSAGLAVSVAAVREWLEKYNENVETLTKNVTSKLGELSSDLSSSAGKYYKQINEHNDLSAQLMQWTTTLGHIAADLHKIETGEINDLDDALKSQIMHEMKPVYKSVELLLGSAKEEKFVEQVGKLDDELVKQKHILNSNVDDEFFKLSSKVRSLEKNKDENITRMYKALGDALNFMDNEFDGQYTRILIGKFEFIMEDLKQLTEDDSMLQTNFKIVQSNLQRLAENVRQDLFKLKIEINKKLREHARLYLQEAKSKLEDLKKQVGETTSIIDTNWGDIYANVPTLATQVTAPANAGSLGDIVKYVSEWADTFKEERAFANIIQVWVEKILLENEIVKGLLKSAKIDSENGRSGIAGVFISQLRDVTTQAAQRVREHVSQEAETKITDKIAAVNVALKMMASAIKRDIKLGTRGKFIKEISKAIDKAEGNNVEIADYSPAGYLTHAVKYILNHVADLAGQHVADLEWLIGEGNGKGNIGKVDEAIHKIQTISDKFNDGYAGQNIQQALGEVRRQMGLFKSALKTEEALADDLASKAQEAFKEGHQQIQELPELMKGFSRAEQALQLAVPTIKAELEHLENVKTDVQNTKKREAAEKMRELKIDVKEKLEGIYVSVGYANDMLDKYIQTLRNTIENARQNAKDAVTSAFATLTSAVRTLFSDAHKADLAALKTLVDGQKAEIEKIIRSAKITGIMGLIRKMNSNKSDFEEISELVKPDKLKAVPTKEDFTVMSSHFRTIVDSVLEYTEEQVSTSSGDPHKRLPTDQSEKVRHLKGALDSLLHYLKHNGDLTRQYLFDHNFDDLLSSLNSLVTSLTPSFSSPSPLLAPLKAGLAKFAQQLGHAYVNRYSGVKMGELTKIKPVEPASSKAKSASSPPVYDLTPEGRNCAKVCLTIVEMVNEDIKYLREQCKTKWTAKTIYSGSSLGAFLTKCGYYVSKAKQDGELRNTDQCNGKNIYDSLVGEFPRLFDADKDATRALETVCGYLKNYYQIGHIASSLSTRRPCSIYEMLGWLTSLVHHPVYFELTTNDFADLFDKPKKKAGDNAAVDDITFEVPGSLLLSAYPQNLTPGDLHDALVHVIGTAPMILTTIVGYGDEYTTYAVDYHSNAAGFAIPSSASSCLSMLLELMRRLFPVFRFLHSRCSNLASEYGWYHCAYGSDVESAGWQCKDHSKTDVDCLPRSPLMSYLRDSLPGHLPHQLTSVDCKSECKTCPKSTPGMPCITPLGFKGFSGSKRTGKDISNVLTKFFDKGVASCLLSLSPRPPSSLPEHYAFALSFVRKWSFSSSNGLKTKIESTMQKASIDLYSDASPLTNALRNAYGEARSSHGTNHPKTSEAAISSLSMSNRCEGANHCGPYLSTLYSDTYPYFGNKHCNAYMSWSVYLPWTFWQQLNSLYDAFLQIFCQDWECTGCLRGDTCKKGTHGMLNPEVPGDGCKCPSIVGCKGVGPTLYQYGFTFQDAHCLISNQTKCFNLRNQLCSVLHSQYFKDLFEKCDEFLWIIRQPFSYLVLALWSLSLFYLICVMVGRLDVLHIKSHLRSPASHRITAQSLLAAAQVGRLAKISYLQP